MDLGGLGVMYNFGGDDDLKDKLFEIAFWDRFSDFFYFVLVFGCVCFRIKYFKDEQI